MKTRNAELTAFYNVVEENVITLMGGYDDAAKYFEKHDHLGWLWNFAEEKYAKGWDASKVARVWYTLYAYGIRPGPVKTKPEAKTTETKPQSKPNMWDSCRKPYKWKYTRKYGYKSTAKTAAKATWKHLPILT
jgi:hypothetical protein